MELLFLNASFEFVKRRAEIYNTINKIEFEDKFTDAILTDLKKIFALGRSVLKVIILLPVQKLINMKVTIKNL